MKMWSIFNICVLVLVNNIKCAQSSCQTPDNLSGDCIPLRECESLHRIMINSYSTIDERYHVRKSLCGRDRFSGPLACCPNNKVLEEVFVNPNIKFPEEVFHHPSNTLTKEVISSPDNTLINEVFSGPKQTSTKEVLPPSNNILTNEVSSSQNQTLIEEVLPPLNNTLANEVISRPDKILTEEVSLRPNNTLIEEVISRPNNTLINEVFSRPNQTLTKEVLPPSNNTLTKEVLPPPNTLTNEVISRPNNTFSGEVLPRPNNIFTKRVISRPNSAFNEVDFPPPGICGTETKERIVGGSFAGITDFPWMALIQYKRGDRFAFLCAGSIINKDYILSAAHCLYGQKMGHWKPTKVRLGEHEISSQYDCEDRDCAEPVEDVWISEIILHENYMPNVTQKYNDIALIRLAHSLKFTDFIKPICLPFAPQLIDKNFDNIDLIVTGFGITENGTNSDIKLQLTVKGWDFDRCKNVYIRRLNATLIKSQLGAGGEDNHDSCKGDSGGPLMGIDQSNPMMPYTYLAGIVSYGPKKCGTKGIPAVHTRVDYYLEWIMDHMRK